MYICMYYFATCTVCSIQAVSVELPLSSVASIYVDSGLVMSPCDVPDIQQGDYIVQVSQQHAAVSHT